MMENRTRLLAELERCEGELKRAEEDRGTLDRAEALYRGWLMANQDSLTPPSRPPMVFPAEPPTAAPEEKPRPPKARIGPQRYHMLKTLREVAPLSADEVAASVGLPARRVRYQLASDLDKGLLSLSLGRLRAERWRQGPSGEVRSPPQDP
jgi:hypothetical protein